ncbi:transglutaminase domain-containing protein [Arthrobacter sp. Sa2BUA2]|uniref:Transglutaminase domain-containing protein n=1 Tax=Arthrobacter pullicola TaxID=2762224 RepID=A0ABR8YFX0_9MICC|nr:DUF3488 and transglutaminase-like domain-containing protein [Arthrobacter pullicola]MBD8043112.1 transglutaminase domain-containing protein [Arthrobacter pullicola]
MTAAMTRTRSRPPAQGAPRATARRASAQWVTGAAAAAAVLLCSLSIHGVLEGFGWMWPLSLSVAAVSVATALARRFRFPTVLVPVAGLASLTMALTWMFSFDTAFLGIIPTSGTAARAGALLSDAQTVVISQVIPVVPDQGVVFIACLAVGLVTVLVDTLAVTLRMPAASGLGLFTILLVPGIIKPQSVGTAGFLAAALGFLLVLAAGAWQERADSRTGRNRPTGSHAAGAVGIGAGAVTAALLLPLAIPGFSTGAFPQGARFDLFAGTTGLNPVVTLGNDLRQPSATGRITYATDSPRPLYLRSTTLEDFSGSRWAPDTRSDSRRLGTSTMTPLESVSASIPTTVTTTVIGSQSYSSPWLLAPYAPSSVSEVGGAWTWDPSTMTILSADGSADPQSSYQVRSVSPTMTGEMLRGIGPAPEGAVDPVFTDLPDDLPQVIRDTAREAVGAETAPYGQALALQSYLRSARFSYSLDAPVEGGYDGNGMDVLARFLEQRSGYCVHFASAMAVMAREVGIPSRMGLGYAPGRATNETRTGATGQELDEFVVDSRDAHAWPELYFEGAGWVRFEPTPSRGVVPSYAVPRQQNAGAAAQTDADPRELQASGPPSVPSPAASPPASPQPVGPAETGGAPFAGAGIGFLAAVLAFLTPRGLRRRRTRKRQRAHAELGGGAGLAWEEAIDLAQDYGFPARTADSPRSYAARLAADAGLTGPSAAALDRLRQAYEAEAYAAPATVPGPPGRASSPQGRTSSSWADIGLLAAGLRAAVPAGTRIKAALFPASLGRGRRT